MIVTTRAVLGWQLQTGSSFYASSVVVSAMQQCLQDVAYLNKNLISWMNVWDLLHRGHPAISS
jgi:hypothetical protein